MDSYAVATTLANHKQIDKKNNFEERTQKRRLGPASNEIAGGASTSLRSTIPRP